MKYAIIGAGPSGLAAARAFQKFGIPFVGFDSHSSVGGMWDVRNENSVVYDSAHLISSKVKSQFSEFPMPADWPDYLSHELVKEYFERFAVHFDLARHYRFSTKVMEVRKIPSGDWEVETEGGNVEAFTGIVMASGPFRRQIAPKIPGSFSGEIVYSRNYKNPEIFRGKRVLIVGMGNTGCDIAVDAIPFAREVHLSTREGNHFIPKFLMGMPTDQLGGRSLLPKVISQKVNEWVIRFVMGSPKAFGLPMPKTKLFERHPILNSLVLHHIRHGNVEVKKEISRAEGRTVFFQDGAAGEIDLILFATGYAPEYPFLRDPSVLDSQGSPLFHLNLFHPTERNIFLIGMVESIGFGWEGRMEQAETVARYIRYQQTGEESVLQEFDVLKRLGRQTPKGHRAEIFVNRDWYRSELAKLNRRFGAVSSFYRLNRKGSAG